MAENINIEETNQTVDNEQKTLANFLVSALDMEDSVTRSVYKDYMNRRNWPENLQPDVFKNIQEYLNILIEDTEKHKKTVLALMQKYGQDKQPE